MRRPFVVALALGLLLLFAGAIFTGLFLDDRFSSLDRVLRDVAQSVQPALDEPVQLEVRSIMEQENRQNCLTRRKFELVEGVPVPVLEHSWYRDDGQSIEAFMAEVNREWALLCEGIE